MKTTEKRKRHRRRWKPRRKGLEAMLLKSDLSHAPWNPNGEEYKRMVVGLLRRKQQDRCAICFKKIERLFLDHNHQTDEVRGLLCNRCNTALGFFERGQRLKLLSRMSEYLLNPPGIGLGARIVFPLKRKTVPEPIFEPFGVRKVKDFV